MKREYHKWFSPNLHRDMELNIYGHAGARVLLFPTRTARFFDYEGWRIIQAIEPFIDNGWLQVYTLDSIDKESFYCFWAHPEGGIQRHMQYENYVLQEVMPLSYQINQNNTLMSVGCSMGAYHAMNIALRHPQWFTKVVSLSGRYDLTLQLGMFNNLLSGYYDENVYHHLPSHYIPNMPEGEQLEKIRNLDITIVIGKDDPFRQNNREFSEALWQKGIWHAFHEWDGLAHRARFWQQMLPMYL